MSGEKDKSRASSGETGIQVAISQDRTQPLTRLRLSKGAVRYMYDRSSDSKATGEPGQDYLTFCCASDQLVFAVCDGVGGSFLGNLAARFLGDHLIEWLSVYPSLVKTEQLQRDLSRCLRELVGSASHLIENYPLPNDLPPIVREVLEEQRAYGSEAMFVCGRIEWPDRYTPRQVALAWLGDAELQVCDRSGRWRRFLGTAAERWSTSRGPRGDLQALTGPADDVARIIGYSDGLRSLADDLRLLPDNMLDQALVRLARDPRNDDLSLIDIALDERLMPAEQGEAINVQRALDGARRIDRRENTPPDEARTAHTTAPESYRSSDHVPLRDGPKRAESGSSPDRSSTILPVPEFLSPQYNAVINPGFELTWTPVPDAEVYMIQEAPDPKFDPDEVLWEFVDQPFFTVEQDAPGIYFYRVRAQTSSAQSAWSSLLRVRIQRIEKDRVK